MLLRGGGAGGAFHPAPVRRRLIGAYADLMGGGPRRQVIAAWVSRVCNAVRGRADAALLESEQRLRILSDGVQGYAIFRLDPRGTVISWDAGAEQLKGYRADQIIGQNYSRFYLPKDIEAGSPERQLRIAAETGRSEVEQWRVREDGSRFWAIVAITAVRDSSGRLLGFYEISRHINAREEAAAKYLGLLEAAPDAMVVVNQSGAIVLLNVQAEYQFGYSRRELVGQQVQAIIPEGFEERLRADETRTAAEALAQQIGTGLELVGLRKDGSKFPIEIMLSPLESAEGVLVTAAIRNISVRRAAETQLAQMESRYRGLLEAAPDAMVVVNQSGAIVLLNVQAEYQFGYSRHELVGQQVQAIIPEGFEERLRADETRTAAEALAQQIGTGLELVGRRKDGSEFPIEIMLSPLESAEGVLVTAAIRNISVRRAAETRLAQLENRYRGLLEAAPDAMVVVNQSGTVVLLNVQAVKQFGYPREELIGQLVTLIIPEGFAERLLADALRSSANTPLMLGLKSGLELTGKRRDGSTFPIEIMLSPLESDEGLLVTAAVRDITERKKAGEHLMKTVRALERSNDELAQFAQVASHDLQEPLRMVASFTQLLAKRYKGRLDADADDFIAHAVDGSNRMQRLIRDLLAFSRAGVKEQPLRETDCNGALQEALANLRATIDESLAVITHDPLPTITTDHTLLTQVFQNLVGNAIKYRGDEVPSVHVSVQSLAGEWIFSVRDNGIGIDPQFFDRIFVIFQRLHGPAEFQGTGIGLAICKKMIARLGGRIWVESQKGKGSTFHFALPRGDGL